MFRIVKFPADQYDTGCEKQTPAEEIADKEHRSKDHKMSPVIDPAIYTAPVFHDFELERTIEQNADVITQKVEDRQKEQFGLTDDAGQIQDNRERGDLPVLL